MALPLLQVKQRLAKHAVLSSKLEGVHSGYLEKKTSKLDLLQSSIASEIGDVE
jgi:hypothetical protein